MRSVKCGLSDTEKVLVNVAEGRFSPGFKEQLVAKIIDACFLYQSASIMKM